MSRVSRGSTDSPSSHIPEDVLIGTLLVRPDRIAEAASRVGVEDIANPRHRAIYETMLELVARGDAIDEYAIVERLKATGKLDVIGGPAFISSLLQSCTEGQALEWHIKEIRRHSRHRRFAASLRDSLVMLEHGRDAEEVLALHQHTMHVLGDVWNERPEDDLLQITSSLITELQSGERGYHWPWRDLDDEVGLLVPGRAWAVSGFSGSGKSLFLRNYALAALETQQHSLAYFALEEDGKDVVGLMACAATGVDYLRFGRGYRLSDLEIERIRRGAQWIQETGRFTLNQRADWTPAKLLAKIRAYCDQGRADVVIIDHAHLLDYAGKNEKESEAEVARFAERLVNYAKTYGFVALVAYQPRKPGESGDIYRPVNPDEMRGTSRIWNIVANSLSPYRPMVRWNPQSMSMLLDEHGLPIPVRLNERPARGENWVRAPVADYFYLQPGKARIGGHGHKPVVFRFDARSARISSRFP